MCMTLGGRAAEVITFRKITTGDQNLFSPTLSLSSPFPSPLLPSLSLSYQISTTFYNTPPSGAQDNLDKVTQMAYHQVVEYSMSPTIGHISPLNLPGGRTVINWPG